MFFKDIQLTNGDNKLINAANKTINYQIWYRSDIYFQTFYQDKIQYDLF